MELGLFLDLLKAARDQGFTLGQITTIGLGVLFYVSAFRPIKIKVEDIKTNFDDLHNATREIQHYLKNKKKSGLNPVHTLDKLTWATANSPLVLNEKGKNLAIKSGIQKIIKDKSNELIALLENCNPTTAYDVEQYSVKVISDYISNKPELEKQIKDFIYNNPVVDNETIQFEDLYFVGSIELRDIYLNKHKEIKSDEKEQ